MTEYYVIRGDDEYSRQLNRQAVYDVLDSLGYSPVDDFSYASSDNNIQLTSVKSDRFGNYGSGEPTDTITAISVTAFTADRTIVVALLRRIAENVNWMLIDDESGEILYQP